MQQDEHRTVSWNIYMKLAAGVMRCPVSFQQPAFVNHPHPLRTQMWPSPRWWRASRCCHFDHGENFRSSPSVLQRTRLRFVSQVSFFNAMRYLPHHTVRWRSIPEMLHFLLESFPEFACSQSLVSALFTWKLRFHTGGVSFHGGILSKSQSASLMVIALPDVSLVTETPLAKPFQV